MGCQWSASSIFEGLDMISANLEGSLHLPLNLDLEDVVPLHSQCKTVLERFLYRLLLCDN